MNDYYITLAVTLAPFILVIICTVVLMDKVEALIKEAKNIMDELIAIQEQGDDDR